MYTVLFIRDPDEAQQQYNNNFTAQPAVGFCVRRRDIIFFNNIPTPAVRVYNIGVIKKKKKTVPPVIRRAASDIYIYIMMNE